MTHSPNLEHESVNESGKQDCAPKVSTPYYSRYYISTYAMSAHNQATTSEFIWMLPCLVETSNPEVWNIQCPFQ
jgi:hypothetical protein